VLVDDEGGYYRSLTVLPSIFLFVTCYYCVASKFVETAFGVRSLDCCSSSQVEDGAFELVFFGGFSLWSGHACFYMKCRKFLLIKEVP
jgi:hypothetical protein